MADKIKLLVVGVGSIGKGISAALQIPAGLRFPFVRPMSKSDMRSRNDMVWPDIFHPLKMDLGSFLMPW